MWKVLIADDEPAIREGLRGMIETEFPQLDVVFEAEDGELAYEYAIKNPPDILLVDICMPFLDGMQLIEQLQEIMKRSIVIIITGHDEFTYAKKAIGLNVFEYILKPVKQDVFSNVMNKAMEQLAESKQKKVYNQWAYSQVKVHNQYLKEKFLRNWMAGKFEPEEIEEQLSFLEIDVSDKSNMLMLSPITIETQDRKMGQWDEQLLNFAIKNIIDELLEEWQPTVSFKDKHGYIVALFKQNEDFCPCSFATKAQSIIRDLLNKSILLHIQEIEGLHCVDKVYYDLKGKLEKDLRLTPIVLLCKNYVDQHYMCMQLDLQTMSEELKISPSYISKLFRKELGVSFVEYLTQVRITKAVELLRNPIIKMYEVAEAVGYKNQHYFSSAFKKNRGISPNKYRKELGKL